MNEPSGRPESDRQPPIQPHSLLPSGSAIQQGSVVKPGAQTWRRLDRLDSLATAALILASPRTALEIVQRIGRQDVPAKRDATSAQRRSGRRPDE
jgi:hypothetical protein